MNAVLYARVSTDDQSERGTIEGQIEFGQKYAELHQLNLIKIYKDDGISGTYELQERNGGKELLNDITSKRVKADILLVYKLDRLGRSARVILNSIYELEQHGVKVKSMTEEFDSFSPSGRFLLTMLAAVADLERETIIERMWHGANRAARKGKWLGGIVPYGYFVNEEGYLEINEKPIPNLAKSEADIVRMMYHLIGNKGYSAWEVAGVLNAMGVPTSYVLNDRKVKKGKRKEKTAGIWRSSRVRNMIYNTVYKGIHYYGKRTTRKRELIPREVPAIVSEELWEKAVQRIKDNKILANKNHKEENLLRGLIKCGVCGRRYYAVYYRNNGRTPTYYYVCSGKVGDQARFSSSRCTSKNVPKEWLENLVWNDIVSFSHNPDTVIRDIVNDLNSQIEGSRKQNIQFEKEMLQKTIESKENEKQAILDLFRKRLISNQDVELQIQKINNEKEELIQRLQTLEQDLTSIQDIQNRLSTTDSVLREVRKKIEGELTFEDKREIIRSLVREIIIHTIKAPGNHRDKANVEIKYVFTRGVDYTGVPAATSGMRLKSTLALVPLPKSSATGPNCRGPF